MQRPLPDSIDVRPLHRPTALLLAGAVLTGSACGPSGGGPMVGPDPGSMTASIPKDAIDLAMAPVTVAAGQELTVCQTARFPLQAPIDVTQISTRQSLSHHVIFYKYMGNSVPPVDKAPRACQPLDLLDGVRNERTELEMVKTKPIPFPPEPARWLGVNITRHQIARSERRQGKRGLWLTIMDKTGLGFDS